jgi:hypothetical protein
MDSVPGRPQDTAHDGPGAAPDEPMLQDVGADNTTVPLTDDYGGFAPSPTPPASARSSGRGDSRSGFGPDPGTSDASEGSCGTGTAAVGAVAVEWPPNGSGGAGSQPANATGEQAAAVTPSPAAAVALLGAQAGSPGTAPAGSCVQDGEAPPHAAAPPIALTVQEPPATPAVGDDSQLPWPAAESTSTAHDSAAPTPSSRPHGRAASWTASSAAASTPLPPLERETDVFALGSAAPHRGCWRHAGCHRFHSHGRNAATAAHRIVASCDGPVTCCCAVGICAGSHRKRRRGERGRQSRL